MVSALAALTLNAGVMLHVKKARAGRSADRFI